MNEQLQLIIFGLFGLLILLLTQVRELLRQITRTAEEWRRMRTSLRATSDAKPLDQETGTSSEPGKAIVSKPNAEKNSDEGSRSEP